DELGRHTRFRHALRERGERYLLGVPCTTAIRDLEAPGPAYQGRCRPPKPPRQSLTGWRPALPPEAWAHVTRRDGGHGPAAGLAHLDPAAHGVSPATSDRPARDASGCPADPGRPGAGGGGRCLDRSARPSSSRRWPGRPAPPPISGPRPRILPPRCALSSTQWPGAGLSRAWWRPIAPGLRTGPGAAMPIGLSRPRASVGSVRPGGAGGHLRSRPP